MQATLPIRAGARRQRWAWYLYDFGNSAYAAVVLLAVYSAYFQSTVVGGAEGTRLWGLAVGVAMLVVAITSPVLGAIADFSRSKKRFLFVYTSMACIFTALLFFVHAGDVFMGMAFFILAEIGYRSAQVFYNALLPDVSTPETMGQVSGNGWAIGSVGGIVCLLVILPLIMFIGGEFIIRLAMMITALFFAISTAPIFLWLREGGTAKTLPAGENYLTIGFRRLWRTFRSVRHFREFVKFLVAFIIFNDGIITALNFAAIIGGVLFGLTQQELIILMILVQVTSVAGAYVFGIVADRTNFKGSLLASLLLMVGAVGWMYLNNTVVGFFIIAALAGFALTGVQSVSRTMIGVLSPPGRTAEFYGLFAVAGRSSSFIGPSVYGIVAAEAALWYEAHGRAVLAAEQAGQRVAILSIILFLVAGSIVLLFVGERRGRNAASLVCED